MSLLANGMVSAALLYEIPRFLLLPPPVTGVVIVVGTGTDAIEEVGAAGAATEVVAETGTATEEVAAGTGVATVDGVSAGAAGLRRVDQLDLSLAAQGGEGDVRGRRCSHCAGPGVLLDRASATDRAGVDDRAREKGRSEGECGDRELHSCSMDWERQKANVVFWTTSGRTTRKNDERKGRRVGRRRDWRDDGNGKR